MLSILMVLVALGLLWFALWFFAGKKDFTPVDQFLSSLLSGIIVVILAGVVVGYVTEQWQRSRQRRDFQFDTFKAFGERSMDIAVRTSGLLMARDKLSGETKLQMSRDWEYRKNQLLGMDAQIAAAFEDGSLFQDLLDLKERLQWLFQAMNDKSISREQFEPKQDEYLAIRKIMHSKMMREMGFLSAAEAQEAIENARKRLKTGE